MQKNIQLKPAIRHLMVAFLLLLATGASAQVAVNDEEHRIDTLSLMERITVRTNGIDWALMVPNVAVEFDLFPQNYNRWSVGVNLRWRPATSAGATIPATFDVFEVTLEGRQYWRERQCTPSGYLRPHYMWYDKILSCRTTLPSHPKWIFYRGGYVSYSKFNVRLEPLFACRKGTAYQAGVTWGFVKPLYEWPNGNSLSFDCGISFGAAYYKYDKMSTNSDRTDFNLYSSHTKILPMVKDIRMAFAYHFGKYPIQKKYRWRYDADMEYRNQIDSLWLDGESRALSTYLADSIYKVVYAEFRELYDSVLVEINEEEKAEAIALKEKKKLELQEELAKDSAMEARRGNKAKKTRKADKARKEQEAAAKTEDVEVEAVEPEPQEAVEPEPQEAEEPQKQEATEEEKEESNE